MTPHCGPYYQDTSGETAPGDWHSPVPISFLAVEAGQTWQLAILPGPKHRTSSDINLKKLQKGLVESLDWLGAGAKTAIGYGRFEPDEHAEEEAQRKEERCQIQLAEQMALDEELSGLPVEVAELLKLSKVESWNTDRSNNAAFIEGLDNYLKHTSKPTVAAIEWIRDHCLEFFWPGIWENPIAIKGKKNKPKYPKRAREFVDRLKDMLRSSEE